MTKKELRTKIKALEERIAQLESDQYRNWQQVYPTYVSPPYVSPPYWQAPYHGPFTITCDSASFPILTIDGRNPTTQTVTSGYAQIIR